MNNKEFLELYNENQKSLKREARRLERIYEASEKERNKIANYVTESISAYADTQKKYTDFCKNVKEGLLAECMLYIMEDASSLGRIEYSGDTLKRNLVNGFIKEHGAVRLLNDFRGKSFLLSEMYRLVNKYSTIITEKADKDDVCTMYVCDEDRNNFFDELKFDDAEETARAIRERVAGALDEFVSSNIQQNAELKEILSQSKEKIDNTPNEELKEYFTIQTKAKTTDVRTKNVKLFEFLVNRLTKQVMLDESLSEIYTKESKIDMEHIIEECTTIYAFLEMLNTAKMVKADSKFINEVIKNIK